MNATFLTRTNVRKHPHPHADVLKVAAAHDVATVADMPPVLSYGYVWYSLRHTDGTVGYSARTTLTGVELFRLDGMAPELERMTDIELLALMVAAEAGNQPLAGQVAVAMVAMERVRLQPRYGAGLRGVLLKPRQFSTFDADHWRWFVGHIARYAQLAELAVGGLLSSPVSGATHYHAKAVAPNWAQPQYSEFLAEIGEHLFYREH